MHASPLVAESASNNNSTPTYEPLQVDAYADHLAEVNQSHQVVAQTDILNSAGILLVRKGQPLSRETVDRIVQFKLLKPLESSIQIDNTLSAETLHDAIKQSIERSGIDPLYSTATINEMKHLSEAFCAYPLLAQKLTVLQLQMPSEFNKSLFVAWAGNEIARQMVLSYEERTTLFIASLAHDFGMLHIPVDVVASDRKLTHNEWRTMISHTVIGQKILEGIPKLSPNVARAVLEHHELIDGTGYPVGKFAPELGLHGHIIALLDSCYAIFTSKLMPQNLSARFLTPILQMNSVCYRPELINLVIYNLRKFEPQNNQFSLEGGRQSLLDALKADEKNLHRRWSGLEMAAKTIATNAREKSRLVRAIATMSDQLARLLRRSGVLDPDFATFIENEAHSSDDEWALEETHLMLQELQWQFQKLSRLCLTAAEDEKTLQLDHRQLVQNSLAEFTSPAPV